MGAQLREYRQRIRSVTAMKKITRAFELIATSRMMKAQQRTAASLPYTRAITRAVSAVATYSNEDHPLTTEKSNPTRSAILLITSDRGLAGAYSGNVIKEAERLREKLTTEGRAIETYVAGRKGAAYYGFRGRTLAREWSGFSDAPTYDAAEEIANTLVEAFLTPTEEGGVDEIHIVYTRFVNMVTQEPEVLRLLPLEVVEGDTPPAKEEVLPLYEFEPGASGVLDALLPQYVRSRVFNALLTSAASELAARQRAMKSATDNADTLIKKYTRLANTARQAEITQEISEIVGGATALADAAATH